MSMGQDLHPEFDKILTRLGSLCQTAAGRELALALRPSSDYAEVVRRQRLTAEARRLLELKPNLSLGAARDVRPHAHKGALSGILEPTELLDVHATSAWPPPCAAPSCGWLWIDLPLCATSPIAWPISSLVTDIASLHQPARRGHRHASRVLATSAARCTPPTTA
jgi:hypothetical protein